LKNIGWAFFLVAAALLTVEVAAEAQQSGKIYRVGFLDQSTAAGSAVLLEAFRQEPSKLGWIEEKNITIECRFAEQKNERLPELATRFHSSIQRRRPAWA
jgi:putative tryptophan/tyrosine transport system substrate-binding protein